MELKSTVYKTTNLITGQYYIGVHKTADPADEYLGSGALMKQAIRRFGKAAFRKDVLFVFDDDANAFLKEQELVRQVRGRDELCLNLTVGGYGGFAFINGKKDQSWRSLAAARTNELIRTKRRDDQGYAAKYLANRIVLGRYERTTRHRKVCSDAGKKAWTGRKHRQETKQAMSRAAARRIGALNSQFGSRWMWKAGVAKKVKSVNIETELLRGWSFGRVGPR